METLTSKRADIVSGVLWKLKCLGRHREHPEYTMGVLRELVRVPIGIT